MIHFDPNDDGLDPQDSRCVGALTAKSIAQGVSATGGVCAIAPTPPRLGVMLGSRFRCDLAMFLLPDGLPKGPGVSTVRGSAHQMDETRTQSRLAARVPMWIAGISVCLVLATGIVVIVRSIPASYANIPDDGAPSNHGAVPSRSEDTHAKDAQANLAAAPATGNHRTRARCPECGVIESMRQIERSGDVGGQDTGSVKFLEGASSGSSSRATAANATAEKDYEFTVRFRDGSTTVFNEASPRSWRLGSRVIVIGRSSTSHD